MSHQLLKAGLPGKPNNNYGNKDNKDNYNKPTENKVSEL